MSQFSLDFAKQGACTLWGSFEIHNQQLMGKMLHQFHTGGSLRVLLKGGEDDGDGGRERLNEVMDRFEALPLWFMKFHSSSDMEEVLVISHSVTC